MDSVSFCWNRPFSYPEMVVESGGYFKPWPGELPLEWVRRSMNPAKQSVEVVSFVLAYVFGVVGGPANSFSPMKIWHDPCEFWDGEPPLAWFWFLSTPVCFFGEDGPQTPRWSLDAMGREPEVVLRYK